MRMTIFHHKPWILAFLLSGVSSLLAQNDGDQYHEPDFAKTLFEEGPQGAEHPLFALLNTLAAGDNAVLRSKALMYAHSISPNHPNVIERNFRIKHDVEVGKPTDHVPEEDQILFLKDHYENVKRAHGSDSPAATFLWDILTTHSPNVGLSNPVDWSQFWYQPRQSSGNLPAGGGAQEPFALETAKLSGILLTTGRTSENSRNALESRWRYVREAMKPTSIGAKVVPSLDGRSSIEVTGTLPPTLASAMHEMAKMFSLRGLSVPRGNRIEITFADGYEGADGPTAVLGVVLLVDSLVSGKELDSSFAAAGDLNADGSVQPIFQLQARLAANMNASDSERVEFLAIPAKNSKQLGDILLVDGPVLLLKTQVFEVATFEDAKALAAKERDADLQQAIQNFTEVKTALERSGNASLLANSRVQEKLSQVLELAPNHLSAKYLLARGKNRHPKVLTLGGSLTYIQHAAVFTSNGRSPKYKDLGEACKALTAAQKSLDPRSIPWMKSIVTYENMRRRLSGNIGSTEKRRLEGQVKEAKGRIDLEYQKLMSNPEAREALMK